MPSTIGEKIRDGIAEFGFKMEQDEKAAKRPDEHKPDNKKSEDKKSEAKPVDKDEAVAADYSEEKAVPKKKPAPRAKRAAKPTTKTKDETK